MNIVQSEGISLRDILKEENEWNLIDAVFNRGILPAAGIARIISILHQYNVYDVYKLSDVGSLIAADYHKVLFAK
jgi:hypothetical protein